MATFIKIKTIAKIDDTFFKEQSVDLMINVEKIRVVVISESHLGEIAKIFLDSGEGDYVPVLLKDLDNALSCAGPSKVWELAEIITSRYESLNEHQLISEEEYEKAKEVMRWVKQ